MVEPNPYQYKNIIMCVLSEKNVLNLPTNITYTIIKRYTFKSYNLTFKITNLNNYRITPLNRNGNSNFQNLKKKIKINEQWCKVDKLIWVTRCFKC